MSQARLYLNVGNTSVQMGVWSEDHWRHLTREPAAAALGSLHEFREALALEGEELASVAASFSTATPAVWEAAIEAVLERPVAVLGRDFQPRIETDYYRPEQLGQDRAANVLAAVAEGKAPCLILDAGTCLTADLVDERGVHLGGAIAPGLRAGMEGMLASAPHLSASLPSLPLEQAPDLGRDTRENLALGLTAALLGTAARLAERLRLMTNPPARVILTGGDATLLAANLQVEAEVWPELTLEGLRRAYEATGSP